MKRVVLLLLALTFVAPVLRAQSFFGVVTFDLRLAFRWDVLIGGVTQSGITQADSRELDVQNWSQEFM